MKYIVGVDIGGTKINTILMNKNAKILRKIKIPTPKKKAEIIQKIADSISFVLKSFKKSEIIGIGLGAPGPMNEKKDRLIYLPNLPTLRNVSLPKIIQKKFKLKTKLENDVSCMALGEGMFGEGKNVKSFFCITMGTGVGGGFMLNGKLYTGRGSAPEIGHITINEDGLKCTCKGVGCLEEYASGRAIERMAKKANLSETYPPNVEKLAFKGNKKAKAIYKELGKYLGIGLSDIVKILDPHLIIIGGGVSNAAPLFLKEAIKELNKRTLFKPCPIKIIKFKDAGAIGAASLLLQ